MAKVTISDDVYERITAFKPIVESIVEQALEFNDYVELLLNLTPDFILTDILSDMDTQILLESLQQLGQRYPVEVYTYIAETMQAGQESIETQKKAKMKKKLGFRLPEKG